MKSPRVIRATQEHEFEAENGLPEALPTGETLLWQGSPDWKSLAVQAFHVRKVAVYFAVVLLARAAFVLSDGGTPGDAATAVLWLMPLVLFAMGMLTILAILSARTTVYTLTNRRVVMRVGIVLTLTFNLPLKRLAGASLRERGGAGFGDIPLQLSGDDKIAYIHLWPHARPWRAARPEPMLRSIPQVRQVARLLSDAWSVETGIATNTLPSSESDQARERHQPGIQTQLA